MNGKSSSINNILFGNVNITALIKINSKTMGPGNSGWIADLDIDSDNNQGVDIPDCSPGEDAIEEDAKRREQEHQRPCQQDQLQDEGNVATHLQHCQAEGS